MLPVVRGLPVAQPTEELVLDRDREVLIARHRARVLRMDHDAAVAQRVAGRTGIEIADEPILRGDAGSTRTVDRSRDARTGRCTARRSRRSGPGSSRRRRGRCWRSCRRRRAWRSSPSSRRASCRRTGRSTRVHRDRATATPTASHQPNSRRRASTSSVAMPVLRNRGAGRCERYVTDDRRGIGLTESRCVTRSRACGEWKAMRSARAWWPKPTTCMRSASS